MYGPDPVSVDILSTGLFCRDALEIIDFINMRSSFECMVIDSTGKILISEGWKDRVVLVN